MEEHLLQIARDRDLGDGIGDLAPLDPEAGGPAAVIAGDIVDAEADQLGAIEAALDIGHELARRELPRGQMEIGRRRARGRGGAARGMGRALEAELAGRAEVEDPAPQYPVLHQREPPVGQALAVEGPGAESAPAMRIIDDVDAGGEDALAELVLQEADAAGDAGAVDGARQMP